MSAYAAAYAPPRGIPGVSGVTGGPPRTYAPPGSAPSRYSPPSTSSASTFAGAGGASSSWPTPEQLVAAVPVRPFEFTLPSRTTEVGLRSGIQERHGVVPKPYAVGEDADFYVLKGVLKESEVAEIVTTGTKVLSNLIGSGKARELDILDTRPSFSVDLVSNGSYGEDLADALRPLVSDVLLPYIRARFACPSAALATARFRRYVPEERRFLPPHHDYEAFATVVIGLQEAKALTGGLFVQGSGRAFLDRKFVPMAPGDLFVHRHDLQHGVEVQDGSRYSLVLFFKDSPKSASDGTCPWYFEAAQGGDAAAQYGWALSLARKHDWSNAKMWLEKACGQDHPEALYLKAEWEWSPPADSGFTSDTARALQLLRRAAELGHGLAQSRLGGMLAEGVKGRVQQDTWEGKRLLRLAFEQDNPDASFHLGMALLKEGDRDGVTKLLAACSKGHPRALFHVAEMTREGQYQLPKNLSKSLMYTKWAAHQGEPQALSNLGHLIITSMGCVRDEAKAVRLFRHAARGGAPEGQLNYGFALMRGNGGLQVDYQEALEWAQKSAAQGHSQAQQALPTFYNAARNPNPPTKSAPTTEDELRRLGVRELRDLLRSCGVDVSDCVEKADLFRKAAGHLPGVAEPWDAAPEHPLLLEPPKLTKAELIKAQREAAARNAASASTTVSDSACGSSATVTTASTTATATAPATSAATGTAPASTPMTPPAATPKVASTSAPSVTSAAGWPMAETASSNAPLPTAIQSDAKAMSPAFRKPVLPEKQPKDFELID